MCIPATTKQGRINSIYSSSEKTISAYDVDQPSLKHVLNFVDGPGCIGWAFTNQHLYRFPKVDYWPVYYWLAAGGELKLYGDKLGAEFMTPVSWKGAAA